MQKNYIFNEYELDKDIPDKIWNSYLEKYKKDYILKINEDGTKVIRCRYGHIGIYSLIKGLLIYVAEFPSKNKKSFFVKKLPHFIEIIQNGEYDVTIKFKEEDMPKLVEVFEVKKKRKLTEDHKEKLRQNLRKINTKTC